MTIRRPPNPALAHELLLDPVATPEPDALFHTSASLLVAACLDARHPVLVGRVLVALVAPDGRSTERWLPTVHGLPVRAGDRVLVARADNFAESLVIGVVDGYARRPECEPVPGPTLALERDASLRIEDADGQPLVELRASDAGPVVRLLGPDVDLELAGGLRVSASSIELRAREGEARVAAAGDVIVTGETIQLN